MKLVLTVEADSSGVRCGASVDATDMDQADLNLYAIGAIEVAKASLLAHRWGVNIGGFKPDPLIENKPTKAVKRKKA